MPFSSSRRHFLATTSLACAGTLLGVRSGIAQNIRRSPLPPLAWLPDPILPVTLDALAASAVDAARQAGASYADVRVAEHYDLWLWASNFEPVLSWRSTYAHGIRVLVDGAWAFVHGTSPTPDAVTTAARQAVITARGIAKLTAEHVELAPAPVVTGTWESPMQIDPFTVPLRDQAALGSAYWHISRRVRGCTIEENNFFWTRETRVFASSEGCRTRQVFHRAEFNPLASCRRGMGDVLVPACAAPAVSGGYEAIAIPGFQDHLKQRFEEASRIASMPRGTIDVGRYPLVVDGTSVGALLGNTLGAALELDRVLGEEADASGTSFLNPPSVMLGTVIASPLLTVMANRPPSSPAGVKWDDEGVEMHPFPVITKGTLVDYHTSRGTATALRDWYATRGQSVGSRGCAMVEDVSHPVMIRMPHLTMTPGTAAASLDDLCSTVKHGLLLRHTVRVVSDAGLGSVNVSSPLFFEIRDGRVVRRISKVRLQSRTKQLWQSLLVGVGDESTVQQSSYETYKGVPWRSAWQSATAPAALFKDVSVVSTERQA
jgi:TldD protein